MKDYPYYNVPTCSSFLEMIEYIKKNYSDRIAFRNESNEWTYRALYDSVMKCSSILSYRKNKLYFIDISQPFYFTIAYFSVVISGNIAILYEQNEIDTETISLNTIQELLASQNTEHLISGCSNTDVCTIVRSSGTTSVAKGVMLSQMNLLCDMIGGMKLYSYPEDAVYYHVVPYNHLFGLIADLMGPLYSGAKICFSDNAFGFFENLRLFQPTNLNLPPVLIAGIWKILNQTSNKHLATGGKLKKILCAGAKANDEWNKLFKKNGFQMFTAYGLTECSPCVSMSRDLFWKDGSAGKILPCCEVKIEQGEVLVKGQNVMLGYWNDDESTRKVMRDGWLYTGDMGYVDSDNFLFLTGRKTNIIVFEDGTKLQPEYLEEQIASIENVDEAVVFSAKERGRTQLVVKVVVANPANNLDVNIEITSLLKLNDLLGKVFSVSISENPLPKNKLGKIIRGM